MIHLICLVVDGADIAIHFLRGICHSIHDSLYISFHCCDRSVQIMGNVADQLSVLFSIRPFSSVVLSDGGAFPRNPDRAQKIRLFLLHPERNPGCPLLYSASAFFNLTNGTAMLRYTQRPTTKATEIRMYKRTDKQILGLTCTLP